MARVYVSIGSNIEPHRHVRRALEQLERQFGSLVISPIYRTRAMGFEGDDFLNLVIGMDTALPPLELAERLRALESREGRLRGAEKFSSRTLDLDILTYGDQRIRDGRLVLPRREITRYAFVLRPLADVAPDAVHPELGKTYHELWATFDDRQQHMERVALQPSDDEDEQRART